MKTKNTLLQNILNWACISVMAASFLVVFLSWGTIPDSIPAHYNWLGEVDRWGSKYELLIMPVVSVGMFALLSLAERNPKIWNIPVQPTPENRERTYSTIKSMICWIKLEVLLIFGYISFMITLGRSLPPALLPITLSAVFGTLIYYIWKVIAIDRETKRMIRIDSEVTRMKSKFPVSKYWLILPLIFALIPFVFALRQTIPGAWMIAGVFAPETLSFSSLHFYYAHAKSLIYTGNTDINLALNRNRVREGTKLCLFLAINAGANNLICFSILYANGYQVTPAVCILYLLHVVIAMIVYVAYRGKHQRFTDAVLNAVNDRECDDRFS